MNLKNYKKTISCLSLAALFSTYGCQPDELLEQPISKVTATADATQAANKISGQYIVVFKASEQTVASIINALISSGKIESGDIKDHLEGAIKGFSGRLSEKQLANLKHHPLVAYIEQDQLISLGTPTWNSPAASGPNKTTVTSVTTEATSTPLAGETVPEGVALVGYSDGTGTTAWVIDSGVDVNNSDLNVDVARSKSFLTTTSIQDGNGHGTMVAGIIGAKNNGSGLIGVAANAAIVALRVVDDAGNGTVTNLIKAVNHVGSYGKAGDVVNISIAASISTTLDNAVKTVAGKGIFFSIAAGNSAIDCSNNSPQRVNAPNVYTVSAMDYNKYFYLKSNFGAPVDRSAPGVNILSLKVGGGTIYGTGTSFAAPHVAGLLLLVGNGMGNIGSVIGDKDSFPDLIAHL